MEYIENVIFNEINIGDSATLEHTITENDINLFAAVSGDVNPAHVDEDYAKNSVFKEVIAHGMGVASFLSTILGTKLPGPGTIYLGQNLRFEHPVRLGDRILAKITAASKREDKNIVEFDCQCTNQAGKVVISGTAIVKVPTVKIRREKVEIPQVMFKKEENHLLAILHKMSIGMEAVKTAIVHPVDELSLLGAVEAAEDGSIIPILVGPVAKIKACANQFNIDINGFEIVNTEHSHEAAEVAVRLAREGKVDALMKGKLHTDELMHAILNKEYGIRTDRRMSHVFAIDADNYPKPLFLSDAAINLFPDFDTKVDIVLNSIELFKGMGLGVPKIAIVSAVETVNPQIPSTVDAAAICKMAERKQICGAIIDGPLAFDNAISSESAKVKEIDSPVAGDADIIIVPDIESGNLLYKQMTYLSGMDAAGIVMGARVPIILTSRGSDSKSRKASALMAQIYATNKKSLKG